MTTELHLSTPKKKKLNLKQKLKTKQTYINLLRYPFFLFLLNFDQIPTIFNLRRCRSPVSSSGIVLYGTAAHRKPANVRIWISKEEPGRR